MIDFIESALSVSQLQANLAMQEWSGDAAHAQVQEAGERGVRRPGRNAPSQLKRAYESEFIRAGQLLKAAFDGNDYARLMMRDAMRGSRQVREALSISDFPNLFADIIDRAVLSNYLEQSYTWNIVAKDAKVSDFRTVKRFRIDGGTGIGVIQSDGTLTPIPMGAPYPEDKLTDAKYQYSVQKYGRRMPFFWETFVNDDLDAIKDTPARFGRAMRRMEEYFVTQMYANNTTYFSVAHKNVLNSSVVTGATTNAPLSSQALIYALIGISQQVDADGQPIMLDNFRLIVPPSLKPTAMNIINSTQIWFNDFGGTIASNTSQERLLVNNWLNSAVDRVAVNYQLPLIDTVHGNTGWYLFADPNNGRPAMEFGRLRIAPAPQLFMKLPNSVAIGEGQFGPGSGPGAGTTNQSPMEGDFDTDSINYKIRHVFGGTLMDPVMGFYSNGSGS